MEYICDVLVVGAGLAGINTALELDEKLDIILISNDKLDKCNSYLAQGGITTVRDDDDIDAFVEDTMRAGSFVNDRRVVEMVAKDARKSIEKLIKYGVDFNKDNEGNFKYTREAAHSKNRIMYSNDSTWREIWEKLSVEVKKRKNIRIMEDTSLVDLIVKDNKSCGAVAKYQESSIIFYAKKIVLACGGIGGIFKSSTNFENIKGIGLALGLRYGIKLKNMEYIQLHPTAFYSTCERRRFLISESVRGEGAKLIDDEGNRFVDELMPRDFVSQSILKHKKERQIPCVLLDARHMGDEYLNKRFPGIYNYLLSQGINMGKDTVPVSPCQHYFMGGIEVDQRGRSSMDNLYACGEVSCTGLHGKNRLASNSLLEATVFSIKVAEDINKNIEKSKIEKLQYKVKNLDEIDKMNTLNLVKEIGNMREDLLDELLDCR
jgi:L-aspartate oxidase